MTRVAHYVLATNKQAMKYIAIAHVDQRKSPNRRVLDFDGGIHYGANELLDKVCSIRPRLHLFGHIHAAYGEDERDGILFSNAALVDERYRLVRMRVEALTPFYIDK